MIFLLCGEKPDTDYASLFDQALMELLFAKNSEYTKDFKDSHGSFRDVCEWHENIKCDENNRVVSIVCDIDGGYLALEYIPPNVEVFILPNYKGVVPDLYEDFNRSKCRGTLNVSHLPSTMRHFDIGGNRFKEILDLTQLPPKIVDFVVGTNKFIGSCDLTQLPASLARCDVSRNIFMGSISLENLPKSLRFLSLNSNQFTGKLNLAYLPESLRTLYINGNSFSGSFVLNQRSAPILIDAHWNSFSGTAIVVSCDDVQVFLQRQETTSKKIKTPIPMILDENGEVHERMHEMLHSSYNMYITYFDTRGKGPQHAMNMYKNSAVQTRDPSMICLERCAHPDQMKVQMMLSGLPYEYLESFRDKHYLPMEIHDQGYFRYKFDDDDRITRIDLSASYGDLYLQYMPSRVKSFVVRQKSGEFMEYRRENKSYLSGSLGAQHLPRCLEILEIANHSFFGVVELAYLPSPMTSFNISLNFMTGTCDLTALPKNLERCLLHGNQFHGTVNFLRLPNPLVELSLHKNKLVGDVIFGRLPPNLRIISVSSNLFCGSFALTEPIAAENEYSTLQLWAHNNNFSGNAVVHTKAEVRIRIDKKKFDKIVDEGGKKKKYIRKIFSVKEDEPKFELLGSLRDDYINN